MRFSISFDRLGAAVMTPLGAGRRRSLVEVGDDVLVVRLGWAFHAVVPRSSIIAARPDRRRVVSRGAHGWSGRWLVNGAGTGLVAITIEPAGRARVLGVPVSLRELVVSADDPEGLVAALC